MCPRCNAENQADYDEWSAGGAGYVEKSIHRVDSSPDGHPWEKKEGGKKKS